MPNNLSVAVTADVADLQAKSAVAKAELSNLTSEMNKLAKQSAAGIIDPAGAAQLKAVAADVVKAKTEVAALSAEMKEMSSATQGVGGVLEELHGKMSTAFEITGIAAAVEGARALGEMIESLGEHAATISTTSDVLGVTTDQFQAMQAAAEDAGVGFETLTRAAEKMNVTLVEARQGSSAAIEKLLTLGLTAQQVNDPTFKLNDTLGVLHNRLIDSSTSQQTMNELMVVLGNRAALAAEAIKKYDGSSEAVKEVMDSINGLGSKQVGILHQMGSELKELDLWLGNAASKMAVFAQSLLPHTTGGGVIKEMIEQEKSEERDAANELQDLNKETLQQEMANAKAGVDAFKQGTQQKLDQLNIYAAAAKQYYGSDEVDVVVKANQEIIAEQRAVDEANEQSFQKQLQREQRLQTDRLSAITKQIDANTEYFRDQERFEEELYGGWARTYTEINNMHANLLRQQRADAAKNAKDEVKSYQGMLSEIKSAESSLISGIISGRRGLSQSLIQISSEFITREIANDVRAMTTRLLLGRTEAAQAKALEEGGFLYHLLFSTKKTAATVSGEAARTSATTAGAAARTAATTAAAASATAVSAATGPPLVMADAARAFAGTYASVAQIPYVGWILAPEAAAAAFAAVSSQVGLASLDTGTNYVPQDMIAQIHEGEQIVPKRYNPAANPALATAGGGDYSEEHNYHGDINVSAFDASSVARMLSKPGYRNSVMNSAMRAFRRGAR